MVELSTVSDNVIVSGEYIYIYIYIYEHTYIFFYFRSYTVHVVKSLNYFTNHCTVSRNETQNAHP